MLVPALHRFQDFPLHPIHRLGRAFVLTLVVNTGRFQRLFQHSGKSGLVNVRMVVGREPVPLELAVRQKHALGDHEIPPPQDQLLGLDNPAPQELAVDGALINVEQGLLVSKQANAARMTAASGQRGEGGVPFA